jgi:predicted nucleic acid-binding protein
MCIDASVAIKWVLPEDGSDRALALANNARVRRERMVAPHLLPIETSNIIRRHARRDGLTREEALRLFAAFERFGVAIGPREPAPRSQLHRRAIEIAVELELPATYDAHYLALAELRRCQLWTADRNLLNAARDRFPLLRWLGDYAPV